MSNSEDSIRILHVEDDPDFADMVATYLEREDDRFVVETATGPDEGLAQLRRDDFDCIVSDYDMPGRNGIEFLEAVRDAYPDRPFILFTGKGSEEVASEAISAGVTDYMQKGSGTDQYAVLANRITNSVEQHAAQREAERDRRRLQELSRSTTDCLWMFDADWTELLFISGYEEVWNRPADAIRNDPRDFLEGVHPQDREFVEDVMDRLSNGESVDVEYRIVRGDDDQGWVWVKGEPIFDDAGDVVRVVGFTRDVTERKTREQRLQETNARLQALFEQSPDMINVHDAAGNLLDPNPRLLERTGYDEAELTGKKVWDLDRALDPETARELWAGMDPGDRERVEGRYRCRDGSTFPVEVHIRRLDIDAGDRFMAISRDITERKERQQKLQTRVAAMEASIDGMAVLDADGEYVFVNQAHADVYGYDDPDALLGETWRMCYDGDELARMETDVLPTLMTEGSWRGEATGTRKDGSTFPQELSLTRLEDGKMICVVRDVTERKRHETALNALQEAAQEFMETPDKQAIAEAAVETARTALDQPISGLWLHDDDALRPAAITEEGETLLGDPPTYTDGETLSWRAFEDGELRVYDDVQTEPDRLNSDTPIRSEIIVPLGEHGVMNLGSTESAEFSPIDVSLARVLGNTVEAALSRADREEQLRSQRAELERQNERLERFTSVVSHDLRNPLNVASGRLELARQDCESEYLDDVARAHDRIEALIDDLLTLAREGKRVDEPEPVELADATASSWRTVDTADATLSVETDRTIRADSGRLHQLLENLFRNAVEHGGADVTVRVGDVGEHGFFVADDGTGIPADERDAVFDAGYSTRGDGTGFGLNIVQEIAEAHGWDVVVTESEAGGARFEITGVEPAD